MPVIIRLFWGALLQILRNIVLRILLALGISVVTYTGVKSSMDWIIDRGLRELAGLPSEVINLLAYMKVGVCISMLMSAIAIRMTLNAAAGAADTIKKFKIGGG